MAKYLNPKADLTFMTEIDENTKDAPAELAADKLVAKALELVEESGYTDAELLAIDKYWDQISRERTAVNAAERKGHAEGRAEGIAEGIEKGRAEGIEKGRAEGETSKALSIAANLLSLGMTIEQVAKATGISPEEINSL